MLTAALAAALVITAPPQLDELARVWTRQSGAVADGGGKVRLTTAPDQGCLPLAVSGTAIVYNIIVAGDLKLSRAALRDILEGRITRWDDPRIAAANPGVTLPKAALVLALPSDQALAPVRALFPGLVVAPSAKRFDDDAAAEFVPRTDNSFGVMNAAQALRRGLYTAALLNRDGQYLTPTPHSVARAAVGVRLPEDLRASIVDASGVDSYPLATLVYGCGENRDFLSWALREGQKLIVPLGFAPLPGLMVLLASSRLQHR